MINKKWDIILKEEFHKPYFKELGIFVKQEYKHKQIFPPYENIFDALRFTDYDEVKVVILGQDPYHGLGEAHGLSFSVHNNIKTPPSLINILKELKNDLNIERKESDLTDWAKQGVLLMNTILTVEEGKPLSHANIGWQNFTDEALKRINEKEGPVVYLLWGSKAIQARRFLNNPNHLILTSPHPSPLSAHRGFFGNNHFRLANEFLKAHGQRPIHWFKKDDVL